MYFLKDISQTKAAKILVLFCAKKQKKNSIRLSYVWHTSVLWENIEDYTEKTNVENVHK